MRELLNSNRKYSETSPMKSARRGWSALCAAVLTACALGCSDGDGGADAAADTQSAAPKFKTATTTFADGALLSVAAGDDSDVWIVGGEKGKAVALRYDGTKWHRHDPPLKQQLWWVHRFGQEDVVVVGESGSVALYSGATWTVVPTDDTGTTYFGAWGSSHDDFWMVGGPWVRAPTGLETQKLVLRHVVKGKVEKVDVSGVVAATSQSLFKVWGRAANVLHVVGDGGTALRYDGTKWAKEETGLVGVVLFTVTGDTDNAWAIGGFGQGQMIHRDNKGAWQSVELADEAPSTLQGISAASGDVWVSGWDGYVARLRDGKWVEPPTGTEHALHAVSVSASGAVWAVGGDIQTLQDDYTGSVVTTAASVAQVPAK